LASFGFAFVEFIDAQVMEEWYSNGFSDPSFLQSAASVLATTMSPQIHPSGFRISDKPAATSFAHQYSFQQVDYMLPDEAAIPSSINLGGVEGAFVKYWDDSVMVAVLEFKVETPPQSQVQASTGPTKEKNEKKKKGVPADCSVLSHQLTGKYIDDASKASCTLSIASFG
jgi:RNA-binding protein 5/10